MSGFHNWIHFYLEESKGQVDYLGLVLPRKRHLEEVFFLLNFFLLLNE